MRTSKTKSLTLKPCSDHHASIVANALVSVAARSGFACTPEVASGLVGSTDAAWRFDTGAVKDAIVGAARAADAVTAFPADAGMADSNDCPKAMFGTDVTASDEPLDGAVGAAKQTDIAGNTTTSKTRFLMVRLVLALFGKGRLR